MLDDCFPYYLSIGMTADEYWNGDPYLVRAYRKAEDIKTHRRNNEMWLQGRYIYDAIYRMLPSLNVWKPKEPLDYMNEPYPLTEKEFRERELREQKKKQEEMREKIRNFAMARRQARKQEEQNNG